MLFRVESKIIPLKKLGKLYAKKYEYHLYKIYLAKLLLHSCCQYFHQISVSGYNYRNT